MGQEIRIGDAEREKALELLGVHLGDGRLTITEYGDRSAQVTTARTRGELLALFADLPAPKPQFEPRPAVPPMPPAFVPPSFPARPRFDRSYVPAVVLGCVALFFAFRSPAVFLLIPVVMLILHARGRRP
ncbi:hypothetical protein GCM10022243_07030 [Saccharothrix violaceirubra]|uniref:DUF1707 domain-containing protein n=1 Tax=Saccharothrix violaceirubra TaxID=413306 RepID=A0A7W7SY59_9PSEU|nr:DUF1707 domain-containing protein [Saccharothrix violaceirubra]MBB4963115.1 hypothetical protein [Saccharothrix violaceirubra]